jgi:hypothetical protein
MPAIAGLRGTGDWGTDERPKNFRETILFRDPNGMAPLTALLSKMGSESTDDPEFAWWEEQLSLIRVTDNGGTLGNNTGSTSLTVVGGGLDLVPGDLLLVEKTDAATYDNEIIEVSSVTSDTAVVVKRGQCGTTVAAAGASALFTKIGNRFAEGTGAPTSSTRNPTKLLNFTQIFKTTYDITNTAKITNLRTGDPLKNDKKRKMFDHAVAMELAFLFGIKNETTGANSKPLRTTGGLRQFITTNRTVFSTTPTVNTFLDAIYPVFDYAGSGAGNERIIFAGNGMLNALNKIIGSNNNVNINYDGVVKQYGMSLQQFVTPQGLFYIRTHPLLNTHSRYTNSAFIINPAGLKYRYLRDTAAKDNIQSPDADETKGQWLTEAGLEVNHERTFAYLGNFTYP